MNAALILEQMQEINQIVRAIRDRQEESDAKLEALSVTVHGLVGRVDGLVGKVDGLENRMDGLESRFDGLDTRMGRMEKELSSFREETRLNFDRMNRNNRAIESDLDRTINRVERLEEHRGL